MLYSNAFVMFTLRTNTIVVTMTSLTSRDSQLKNSVIFSILSLFFFLVVRFIFQSAMLQRYFLGSTQSVDLFVSYLTTLSIERLYGFGIAE